LGGAAKLRAMEVPVRTLMAFEGTERAPAFRSPRRELRAPVQQALFQARSLM